MIAIFEVTRNVFTEILRKYLFDARATVIFKSSSISLMFVSSFYSINNDIFEKVRTILQKTKSSEFH